MKARNALWIKVFAVIIFLLISIVVISIVGSICYIIVNFNYCNVNLAFAQVESSLLANGLAIIGITIAIWAGLNIFQTIERNKYEELSKEVERYRKDRVKINVNQIVMLLNRNDKILNRYLVKLFLEASANKEIDLDDYSLICNIEQQFLEVYQSHYNHRTRLPDLYMEKLTEQLEEVYKKGVQTHSNSLEKFALIRMAEVCFYWGYFGEQDVCCQRLNKCIQLYYKVFPGIQIYIEQHADKTIEFEKIINTCGIDDLELLVYALNTIAESYNKIYQYHKEHVKCKGYERNSYLVFAALFCLLQSTHDNKFKREVYYRNFATFFEHQFGRSLFYNREHILERDQAQYLYEQSIKIMIRNKVPVYACFYAYLQFMHRKFEAQSDCYSNISNTNSSTYNKLLFERQKVLKIAELAVNAFPLDSFFVKHQLFSLYELWKLHYNDAGKQEQYRNKFMDIVNEFEFTFGIQTDFYSQQLETIKKRLS